MPAPSTVPTWATSGSAAKTAPSGTKKSLGWVQKEKPDHNWLNWFWNITGRWLTSIADSYNSFAAPEDAIDGMTDGQVGYVYEDDSANGGGITLIEATTAAVGVGTVDAQIDTAGHFLVFGNGDMDPLALDRQTLAGSDGGGGEIRDFQRNVFLATSRVLALRTDGEIVVAAYGSATQTIIECWNASTGGSIWTVNWGGSVVHDIDIDGSGVYAAGDGADGTGDITIGKDTVKLNRSTGAAIWEYDHGGIVYSIRTNGRQVFLYGTASSIAVVVPNTSLRAIIASNGYDANNEGGTGQDTTGLAWDLADYAATTTKCLGIGHGRVWTCRPFSATYQVVAYSQADGSTELQYAHADGNLSARDIVVDQDFVIIAYQYLGSSPVEGFVQAHEPDQFAVAWRWGDYEGSVNAAAESIASDGFAVFAMGYDVAKLWKVSRGNVPTQIRRAASSELERPNRWYLQPAQRRI